MTVGKANYGRYGYRHITPDLHNEGSSINHKTIQRLTRQLNVYRETGTAQFEAVLVFHRKFVHEHTKQRYAMLLTLKDRLR